MAVELTPEEQAKLDEKLKELGFDEHAKKVIERTNAEAKANRERAEKAEEETKKFRDAEALRKAEDDKRKADEETAKKKAEDEKKTVEERLSAIEKNFAEKLTASELVASKKQQEFLEELKARDAQILMQAVRTAASKRGIIDEDLVTMLDVSKVPTERGVPSQDAIDELVEGHATSKPHLYRSAEDEELRRIERERDEQGRFSRPKPTNKSDDVDAAKLDDAAFSALEERLRKSRV